MTNGDTPSYMYQESGTAPIYPLPPERDPRDVGSRNNRKGSTGTNPVKTTYIIICCFAFGLLLISGILNASVRYMEEPDDDDYDYDESDQYDKDLESYEDTGRNLMATSSLFRNCGAVILSAGLLIAVFLDKSLSSKTKLGMLIAVGLILGLIFSPGIRTEDLMSFG